MVLASRSTAAIVLALLVAAPLAAQTPIPTVTLREARHRAATVDPTAVAGRANADAATWQRRSAWADLLTPQVTLGANYTHYSEPFFNFGTGNITPNSTNATVEARYLLIGSGRFTTLRRAQAALTEAEAAEVAAKFQSEYVTDATYYGVLAGEELTRVAADRLKRAEEGQANARARVLAGSATASDSLQTLLKVNDARLDLMQRTGDLAVARLALGRRIGITGPAAAAPLDSVPSQALPLTLEAATRELLDHGPDLTAARATENSASAVLWSQRERYLPDVTLSATAGAFDEKFFPSATKRSQLAITAAFPLWDAGRRETALAQARANNDIARTTREDQERGVAERMTGAWSDYNTAVASLEFARTGVRVSTENFRIQEVRYREGASTINDLLTAQVAEGEADSSLVQARYAARLSLARIEALLGRRLFDTTQ